MFDLILSKGKDLYICVFCVFCDNMANITISVPEGLKHQLEAFPEINWSGLMRKYLESRVARLVWKEQMLKELEADKEFDEIALEIGNKMKQGVWERLKKEGW